MNKIERMLQELCPNGVEYKKLGEVCEFQRGSTITAKEAVEGDVPVIAGGQKPAYYHNAANRQGKTVVVAGSGAYAGFVTYWEIPIFVSDAFSVNPNGSLDTKYLYYYLKNIQEKIHATKKGSGVPHVHGSSIAKFEIPVPPLSIQEEIVRILDRFTELAASLQAELQARKEQYEYYRNKSLTFDNIEGGTQSVTWMKMSEIGDFYSGLSGKSKSDFENGNSKYATYMNVYKNLSLNIHTNDMVKIAKGEKQNTIQQGDVLFTGSSETPDECGMSSVVTEEISEPIYLNSFCFGFRPYDKSLFFPDFLKHLLRSKTMRAEITKTANGVTRFNVSKKLMGKILLPIPPYKEQKRLATILDKFETLVNDLSQGLPAEIAAVQEQYEYYRNKLLTFKRIA